MVEGHIVTTVVTSDYLWTMAESLIFHVLVTVEMADYAPRLGLSDGPPDHCSGWSGHWMSDPECPIAAGDH